MLSRLTRASQYLASSAGVAYISRKNSYGTIEPPDESTARGDFPFSRYVGVFKQAPQVW
jgi:hypothetical protein